MALTDETTGKSPSFCGPKTSRLKCGKMSAVVGKCSSAKTPVCACSNPLLRLRSSDDGFIHISGIGAPMKCPRTVNKRERHKHLDEEFGQ